MKAAGPFSQFTVIANSTLLVEDIEHFLTMLNNKVAALVVAFAICLANGIPVGQEVKTMEKKQTTQTTLVKGETPELSPLSVTTANQPISYDFSQMVETKEEDIPDGTWVLQVDEPIQSNDPQEMLQTASNVVFRPLFRYREKQSNRRRISSARRRYYVPRRSYRNTSNYYRPYRSVQSHYYPYRYYGYYG